jgi:outer membrane protein OmpA-like peptidoglycan-associated protein
MAESVKRYLVGVFGIDTSRINTEGRVKPRIPSEEPGGTLDLKLLRESDRRVSIWSTSPALLMEFQSGPDAPLKPVVIVASQEAPLDSYVSFNVEGAKEAFSSWSLEIRDEKGTVQNFGPYTQEKVSIPGKSILGTRPQGDYKVTMIGKTKSGKMVKKDASASVHVVLWTPSQREEGMRFSIVFEFNESKSITIYEKYLTDIVTPKIPKDGTVIIRGYTDIIGDEAHNLELSLARANDVRGILENALSKAGRTDVKFEVHGFGEDEKLSPFENNYPEERFYNRTVIIDILPPK